MVLSQLTDNDLLQKLSAIMVWVNSSNNDLIGSFCAVETQKKFAELKGETLIRMEKSLDSQDSWSNRCLLDDFLKTVVRIINTNSRTVQDKYWKIRVEILSRMKGSPPQMVPKTAKKKK